MSGGITWMADIVEAVRNRLRARREEAHLRRLREDFAEFYEFSTYAKMMPREEAFRMFCRLESMGRPAVAEMLAGGAIERMTAH